MYNYANMYNYSKNILLLNPYVVTLRKILLDVLKLFPEYPNEQEGDNQNSIYLLFFYQVQLHSHLDIYTRLRLKKIQKYRIFGRTTSNWKNGLIRPFRISSTKKSYLIFKEKAYETHF